MQMSDDDRRPAGDGAAKATSPTAPDQLKSVPALEPGARCSYCGRSPAFSAHVITVDRDSRIQVLAGAAHCTCGYVVLSPCALLALDEITRLLNEPPSSASSSESSA